MDALFNFNALGPFTAIPKNLEVASRLAAALVPLVMFELRRYTPVGGVVGIGVFLFTNSPLLDSTPRSVLNTMLWSRILGRAL